MCKTLLGFLILFVFLCGCAGRQSPLAPPSSPPIRAGERGIEPGNKLRQSTEGEEDSSEYRLAVNRLLSLAPSAPPFEIEVWTGSETYHIGEAVTLFFRSGQDTHLTLIDIGTDGTVKTLFPNPFQKESTIQAGRIYSIPAADDTFDIRAEGPPGMERIKAIATPAPLFPLEAHRSEKDGETVQQLLEALGRLDSAQWTEGQTEFRVIEKGVQTPSKERPREIKPKKPEKPIDITGTPGMKPPEKSDKK